MSRIIVVSSGKGGVGKTTLTSNLGLILTEFGKNTLVLDSNLTTPNLGFHLGVPLYPKTLHDVLRGTSSTEEAMFTHPSGLKVLPAGISINDLKNTKAEKLNRVVLDLVNDHDIVLLDGAAGLGKECLAGLESADEVVVVTNSQLPSVTDALKTVKVAEEVGTHVLGVVVNRVNGKPSELTIEEIESLVGYPVLGVIPEDEKIHDSLAAKTPIVAFSPSSKASVEMKKIAAHISGVDYEPPQDTRIGFLSKIFSFLRP